MKKMKILENILIRLFSKQKGNMMSIFDFDTISKVSSNTPIKDMCRCNECNWEGKVKDCEAVTEQESWELPKYTYHICPNCDSETGINEDYWSSEEYKKEEK